MHLTALRAAADAETLGCSIRNYKDENVQGTGSERRKSPVVRDSCNGPRLPTSLSGLFSMSFYQQLFTLSRVDYRLVVRGKLATQC